MTAWNESIATTTIHQIRTTMKKNTVKNTLALVTLLAISTVFPSHSRAGTFTDDFSGGLSPYFNVTQTTAGLYSVNSTQGNVQLAWAGTANPGGLQTANVNLILPSVTLGSSSIAGDFSTSIDFSNAALPGPGLDQVHLNVLFSNGTSYDFLDVFDNDTNHGGLNVHVFESQNNMGYGFTSEPSVNHGTFTVSRTGSTITGYFNGTAIFSDSSISASVQGINLSLQNNNGSSDSTAVVFDNFSLTAANVVPEPSTWAAVLAGAGFLAFVCRRCAGAR